MARVLLTGGGGYIGGELCDALLARGDEVVALARSDAAAGALGSRGAGRVRVVRGDVLSPRDVAGAVAGCDLVHHVAGVNSHCPRDPRRMWQVNVLGPQTVVAAAAHAGVARVVHTSSSAVVGEAPGVTGGEGTPHRGWFLSDYEQSKRAGERAALLAAQVHGVAVVALEPTSVQGPPRSAGTGAIVLAYLNRRLRVFVETVVSVVDVRDVVAAHLAAETRGRPGARYVLSGPGLSSRDALALIAELSGVRYRVWFVAPAFARGVAAGVDRGLRASGRHSAACPARVATLLHGHRYDGSPAERELGVRYTPIADTLRRTIAWARATGRAPAR